MSSFAIESLQPRSPTLKRDGGSLNEDLRFLVSCLRRSLPIRSSGAGSAILCLKADANSLALCLLRARILTLKHAELKRCSGLLRLKLV